MHTKPILIAVAPLLMYEYANLGLFPDVHALGWKQGHTEYSVSLFGTRLACANKVLCCWQVYEDTLEGVYLLLRREMQEKLVDRERFWQVAKVQMTRVCTLEETVVNYVNWKMIETLPYYKSVLLGSASFTFVHLMLLSQATVHYKVYILKVFGVH